MKEKLGLLNYKYRVSIIVFMFFLIIFSISPLSGDVVIDSINNSNNLLDILKGNVKDITSYLVSFFAKNRLLFNFLFSGLITLFIYNINSLIIDVRNKHFYLFSIILLFLVSHFTFSYNYMSIKGAINYTIPSLLMILYFIKFNKLGESKKGLIYLLLTIIIVINLNVLLGILFVLGNVLYFILTKNKKIKLLLSILLIGLINILYKTGIDFSNNLFVDSYKILKDNIYYSIKAIFSNNIVLFIIGAIPINYYLKDKLKSNMYRRIKMFMFNIPLFLSLAYNFGNYIPVNFELILTKYSGVFAVENYYFIGYFLLYLYLLVLTTIHFIKNNYIRNILVTLEGMIIVLFILSFAMKSINEGIYIFILLSLTMIIIMLFTDIKIKIYPRSMILVTILFILYYLSIFTLVRVIENKRIAFIKKELAEQKETVVIPASPFRILYRVNPDDWDINVVKEYYNIPKDKNIDIQYIGIFKEIEERVK